MTTARRAAARDPTVYPVEERVGEDILQRWICELLRPLLDRWLRERGVRAFVGADQFIYWKQYDPGRRVAPDVYMLPGVDPDTHVSAWKIWVTGVAPSFAFEVVSKDWQKDYSEAKDNYEPTGVRELVVFDPGFARRPVGRRWQVFRRVGRRGLVLVEATNDARVRSKVLDCWLVAVGSERATRVRIGLGAHGLELVPTAEEAERAAKESERAAKESERAAKESARAEKDAALARIAELEAQVARLSGRRKPRRR